MILSLSRKALSNECFYPERDRKMKSPGHDYPLFTTFSKKASRIHPSAAPNIAFVGLCDCAGRLYIRRLSRITADCCYAVLISPAQCNRHDPRFQSSFESQSWNMVTYTSNRCSGRNAIIGSKSICSFSRQISAFCMGSSKENTKLTQSSHRSNNMPPLIVVLLYPTFYRRIGDKTDM